MQNILAIIKNLDIKDWYYYYQISQNPFENPFKDKIPHLDFIIRYFERAGKEKVLQEFDVTSIKPERAAHTNSVFFLGIYLYNKTIFKNYIEDSFTIKGYRMFPFMWFLITLFHDFGYKYEKNFSKYKHILDIDTLRKELNLRYNLLKYKKIKGVHITLYSYIRNYFLYRRFNSKYKNAIDHGILAGLFFYDALVRNRIKQYNEKSRNDLYFGRELNKAYAQAAAVISTHNIWFPNEKNASEYRKFGMDNLIGIPPIKISESPLLVLLGIIDTIDPVKIYFNEYSPDLILQNLLFSCQNKCLILENGQNSPLDFNKIIQKTNYLGNWLDVHVTFSPNSLKIELNT